MNNTKETFLALAFGILAFLLLLGFPDSIQKQPDSDGYLIFAEEIASAKLFTNQQASWASVIRTPGYPLLLALSQMALGQNPAAVVLVHMSLALVTLGILVFRLRQYLSAYFIVALSLFAFWLWRDYYDVVLTEWSAFCVLLIFLALAPQNYDECSPRRLFSLGVILSFLILIRPAMLSSLLVVLAFVLLVVRLSDRRKVIVGLLVGLLPLFFWCTYNSYRIGTFGVAAFSGHNLFGVASLLGSTQFKKDEWPDLARFSSYVNELKLPKAGQENELVKDLPGNYYGVANNYNYNIYQVALEFEAESNFSRQHYDYMMSSYASEVLWHNPYAYLKFIFAGLSSLLRDAWLIMVAIILLFALIRSGHPLSLILGAVLGTHISHILLCSAVQIVINRYYLLTAIPLGLLTVISMLAVLKGTRRELE